MLIVGVVLLLLNLRSAIISCFTANLVERFRNLSVTGMVH